MGTEDLTAWLVGKEWPDWLRLPCHPGEMVPGCPGP